MQQLHSHTVPARQGTTAARSNTAAMPVPNALRLANPKCQLQPRLLPYHRPQVGILSSRSDPPTAPYPPKQTNTTAPLGLHQALCTDDPQPSQGSKQKQSSNALSAQPSTLVNTSPQLMAPAAAARTSTADAHQARCAPAWLGEPFTPMPSRGIFCKAIALKQKGNRRARPHSSGRAATSKHRRACCC